MFSTGTRHISEGELLRTNHFRTREEARHAVAEFIDEYNGQRHSTNGMLSPIDYERACADTKRADEPEVAA
jgi:putative transposase